MSSLVQGLWVGESLSSMEQLSITSFLANGHEYHLYAYTDVAYVPRGAVLKDAAEILPSSMIFRYRDYNSYAGFSNFFRYKLLLERGGWWVDTDVICLRPFAFDSEYVFATERDGGGREFVTSCVIKAPKGGELVACAWEACRSKDPQQLRWGETGPNLMHFLVPRLSLCDYAEDADVFCPIDPGRWIETILPGRPWKFGENTFAVHLWNELWRRWDLDKNETYAPDCLYERLKRQYLHTGCVGNADAAATGRV